MKNPLYKRIPREFKRNIGKNIAMFLFLTLTIGFCSGYFIATGSLANRLSQNYDHFLTEDGHFTLTKKIDSTLEKTIINHHADLYELFYKDKVLKNNHVMRIYKIREKINLIEMYSGEKPKADNEISIDRLYARNNQINIGDEIELEHKKFKVTGFSTVPDYTSLYKNNTDFMFDALTFCVGFVTDNAFEALDETGLQYNYAWMYHDRNMSEEQKHEHSEALMNDLADCAEQELEQVKKEMMKAMLSGKITLKGMNISEEELPPMLTDFIPSDANSAINMATEDVGGDKIIVMWLLYITMGVIALATAITTKSTVEQEASVIGTLRASGYYQRELIGHYMVISFITTFAAAVIGNIIGYTLMNNVCASMYYGSYSFPVYEPDINAEAFIMTTIIPVMIVLAVHFIVLVKMISLPPLQFLRKELKKKKNGKSIPLKFGTFTSRFRTRVIFRNYQAYIILFIGITFANLLLMFSLMWTPLLNHFRDTILDNVIAENQYFLKAPAETNEATAEKFAVYSVKNENDEDITIYGISDDSQYIKNTDFSDGKIYFSSAYADKYHVNIGDTVLFKEKFGSKKYYFTNHNIYNYPSTLCIFMGINDFRKIFNQDDDYYTGYFCNQKITDIDDIYIASIIGKSDLTSTADQLENSVGFVKLFSVFAIAVYILMIYILSKMITERNTRSISVLKILGYKNTEISGLYHFSTGIVVLISMIISIPIIVWAIQYVYYAMMLRYNGWMTFYISPEIYPQMIGIGCVCFLAEYLLEMRRVRKIAMNEAIKDID